MPKKLNLTLLFNVGALNLGVFHMLLDLCISMFKVFVQS